MQVFRPDVASITEFVAEMRRLREASGLTIREIEQLSQDRGEFLARSTLSSTLNRTTLPRESVVVSLVRVCGGTDDDVAAWLANRSRLANPVSGQGQSPVPEPEDTAGRGDRGWRRRIWSAAALVPVCIAGTAVAAALSMGQAPKNDDAPGRGPLPSTARPGTAHPSADPPRPEKGPLDNGRYRIHTADGRCLREKPGKRQGASTGHYFYATSCANGASSVIVRRWSDGTYKIMFDGNEEHDEPKRCLGVVNAGINDGASVSIQYCGQHALPEAEQFRVEPSERYAHAYTLRASHLARFAATQDLCIGSPRGDTTKWANLFQLECEDEPGKSFTFQKVT
ncbi:helix-turn-helix domain-containing protein (plasmid) [Streptomyces sp. NBC_01724]|uniref:helix-turn-helix transcriptional regulator n=1 Tax=Streptomyces sp. NBC_01724 TaxID=2975922 RepID=UPI002E2FE635|nr:helix-turn-helix transcriptional regulator [Streptomyces sp. NBC_01724]